MNKEQINFAREIFNKANELVIETRANLQNMIEKSDLSFEDKVKELSLITVHYALNFICVKENLSLNQAENRLNKILDDDY